MSVVINGQLILYADTLIPSCVKFGQMVKAIATKPHNMFRGKCTVDSGGCWSI